MFFSQKSRRALCVKHKVRWHSPIFNPALSPIAKDLLFPRCYAFVCGHPYAGVQNIEARKKELNHFCCPPAFEVYLALLWFVGQK
jgi:hypothetical protein